MRTARLPLLFLLTLTALPVFSATYIVPDDRELISAAQAIVTGTVVSTHVRRGVRLETVTEIEVEEWIRGQKAEGRGQRAEGRGQSAEGRGQKKPGPGGGLLPSALCPLPSASIEVVLPGGQLGDERLTVPGVPSFRAGDRVLLFLVCNGRGEWTTLSFALGAFVADGRGVLARGEIFGWAEAGERHVERARLERPFVDYVRAVVRGEDVAAGYFAPAEDAPAALRVQPDDATYSAGSYAYHVRELPLRRNGAVGEWRISGQAGDLDIARAADAGVAAWAAITPTFRDTRGAPATGDLDGDDGEWRIIAGDPHGEIPDVCCFGIIAGTFLIDNGSHVYNGQTFRTLTHADLLLNDGISSASFTQAQLDDIVTHEIGHTLGLRHADRNSANDAACPAGSNCCLYTNDGGNCESVMNSVGNPKISGLHKWDRDAIACLYEGNCTAACVAPSFLDTPQG
ncbi:MAG TPA: M57 family metalloprotease, partial [Thermoanaerobaculia bacterium]|nr:M57 family metalloprotease [Thermoanaerobaculia bacterium]